MLLNVNVLKIEWSVGPRLNVGNLKGALTSRPMLRGGNFQLAQPCVGVAQFCDAFLVRGYLVLVVSAIGLSVA